VICSQKACRLKIREIRRAGRTGRQGCADLTPWFPGKYGWRVSELEAKYIMFLLSAIDRLALWAGSEAMLPVYLIGTSTGRR